MKAITTTRRELLLTGGALAAAISLGPLAASGAKISEHNPADPWRGLKVGVASYSYRKLPLDACIKGIRRVALHYVSIKDFHLPMNSTTEQRKEVAKKFRDAGIEPLSCGVVYMKNDEKAARNTFEYARDIAVPTIVCMPDADALPMCERLVKEFDIRMAIHNHGPEAKEWKSPMDVLRAVEGLDPRIGLCIDVGHTARAGVDPATAIRTCKARLYDCHMKDISNPHGRSAGSSEVEVGRGILDVRGMLEALLDVGFKGHVGFEHEKDPNDPIPGLAESVGYTKGVMSQLPKG